MICRLCILLVLVGAVDAVVGSVDFFFVLCILVLVFAILRDIGK